MILTKVSKSLALILSIQMMISCGTRDYETSEEIKQSRDVVRRESDVERMKEEREATSAPLPRVSDAPVERLEDQVESLQDLRLSYRDLEIVDARLNRYYAIRGAIATTLIGSLVGTAFILYYRSQERRPFWSRDTWQRFLWRSLIYTGSCAGLLSLIAYSAFIPPRGPAEVLIETERERSIAAQFERSARESEGPILGGGLMGNRESEEPVEGPTPWQ